MHVFLDVTEEELHTTVLGKPHVFSIFLSVYKLYGNPQAVWKMYKLYDCIAIIFAIFSEQHEALSLDPRGHKAQQKNITSI